MAALIGRMVELGYGVAYRVLDARHFGVPQRRRRVFILGLRSDPDDPSGRAAAERAAQVLAVGTRCPRHPASGGEAGAGVAGGPGDGVDVVGAIDAHHGRKWGSNQWVDPGKGFLRFGQETHAPRNGTTHGLASGMDDRDELAGPIPSTGQGGQRTTDLNTPLVYTKAGRAQTADDGETWTDGSVMPTLNAFDVGDVRTTAAILGTDSGDDPLLPLGLDSHRYRCCGNGVVANVAEWIATQLLAALPAEVR